MKVTKHITNGFKYYECEPVKGIHLYSFTLGGLIRDLLSIYKYTFFNPLSLN